MTAAIFGLIGVIVGALINGTATMLLHRRTERSDARSAVRLVASELARFYLLAKASQQLPPDHLPQLHQSTPVVWESNRGVLARSLSSPDWKLVALAYARVDALNSVLIFEQDGTLVAWRSREAERLLGELLEPVTEAVDALATLAGVTRVELTKGEIVAA